jgi:hypothetical protein
MHSDQATLILVQKQERWLSRMWLKSGKQLNVTGLLYFACTHLLKYSVLNYDFIKSRLIFAALFRGVAQPGPVTQSVTRISASE